MTEQTSDQGQGQSLQDRIASAFGGGEPKTEQAEQSAETAPEEAASQEEAPTPVEETFELDYEGEKFTLPKKLEKGFMQEKDYTQKSQSIAEQKRTIEHLQQQMRVGASAQQFRDSIQPDLQKLAAAEAQENYILQNWHSLSEADRAELPRVTAQVAKTRQELQGKQQQFLTEQQQAISALRSQSLEIVKKSIPNWNENVAKAIREHAISEGYTAEEIGSIHDPRHALTLWKAAQYDAMKAKAAPVVKTAPVAKPGPSNPMPADVKDRLNYRKQLAKAQKGSTEHQRLVKDRVASIFSR